MTKGANSRTDFLYLIYPLKMPLIGRFAPTARAVSDGGFLFRGAVAQLGEHRENKRVTSRKYLRSQVRILPVPYYLGVYDELHTH